MSTVQVHVGAYPKDDSWASSSTENCVYSACYRVRGVANRASTYVRSDDHMLSLSGGDHAQLCIQVFNDA